MLAIATLHNILRKRCGQFYMPRGTVDNEDHDHSVNEGDWRNDPMNEVAPLQPTRSRNSSNSAKVTRNLLANYFSTQEGEVAWQYSKM